MDTLKTYTDDRLVNLYIAGRDEAFDVLLERYKDRLYSYIFYSIHNADMADDFFQETFVKVITTLRSGRYTETGKFYPWLTRIAHNLIIDQFRTEKSENTLAKEDLEKDLANSALYAESSTETQIVAEQTREEIFGLIDFLPETQREIVTMRIYNNLSFKEIAEQKGLSINTALGRMRYAVLNMRRMANERNIHCIPS